MTIVYFGSTGCADSDFPLIRALQKQGIEVYSYFHVNKYTFRSGLFNIKLIKNNSIVPASQYQGLDIYKDYLDLNKVFIINQYYISRRDWHYWLCGPIWIKVFCHIKKRKAQILHLTWPLKDGQKILYKLKLRFLQTIHDPFPHSGQYTSKGEKDRKE